MTIEEIYRYHEVWLSECAEEYNEYLASKGE